MSDPTKKTVYTPNVLWLDGEDAEIAAAIRKAQRTFGQYREELRRDARRTTPAVQDCGVKVFFPSPTDPLAGEHMWVNDVMFGRGGMQGTLCNDPGWLRGLANGDRVSDWFFVVKGVLRGGFTLKILYRHYTPEQFAECQYDPPQCYLADWYAEQQSKQDG